MRTVYLVKEIEEMPGFSLRSNHQSLYLVASKVWRGPDWTDVTTPYGSIYIPNRWILCVVSMECYDDGLEDQDDRE